MKTKPSISIIGTGALGSSLLDFFRNEQFPILSIWNSREGKIFKNGETLARSSDKLQHLNKDELGEWIFITVPDDQIKKVSETLSLLDIDWSGRSVVHCSGSKTSAECRPLAEKGALTASMHPIQTFRRSDGRERLSSIYISVEGDSELTDRLSGVIGMMNSKAVPLTIKQKQVVHLAAVLASNYLVTLLREAEELLEGEKVEGGLNILHPLINQTVQNVLEKGTAASLSGPVSRGDSETLQSHLELLEKKPDKMALYKILGRQTVHLAKKNGQVPRGEIEKMEELLKR